MQWKYWDPWADWAEGSRGYVLEQDGRPSAHGAAVPLTCAWGERRIRVVRVIDWAADTAAPGIGVLLLRRIGQKADAVMAVGGSEMTLKIFGALGAKHCGTAHYYVRPLRPFARLAMEERRGWRAGARLARALWWSMRAPSSIPVGWTARRIGAAEAAEFPRPKPLPGVAVFERSVASLEYYLRSPATPFELYAVEKNGARRGYFLLAILPRQARLAESWIDSTDPAEWRAVHLLAVERARAHREAVELATMCSDPLTRQSLEEVGFHRRGAQDLYLLPCSKAALPDVPLRAQMMEGDFAYLDDGELQS